MIRMSPFDGLYGQSDNTPISWSNLVNGVHVEPDMLKDMKK